MAFPLLAMLPALMSAASSMGGSKGGGGATPVGTISGAAPLQSFTPAGGQTTQAAPLAVTPLNPPGGMAPPQNGMMNNNPMMMNKGMGAIGSPNNRYMGG